jgi:hypothetical protein
VYRIRRESVGSWKVKLQSCVQTLARGARHVNRHGSLVRGNACHEMVSPPSLRDRMPKNQATNQRAATLHFSALEIGRLVESDTFSRHSPRPDMLKGLQRALGAALT